MKLKNYFIEAISQPPHVTFYMFLKKIKRILVRYSKFKTDQQQSSYCSTEIIGSLGHFYGVMDIKCLAPYAKTYDGISSEYLKHRFDLLGSGWVQVEHNMYCQGVEGFQYEMGTTKPLVNKANLAESKRILSLITNDYRLIDWQLDFKSGFRWDESTWYEDIAYGENPGVDIKVPWELARMQHLPQLAFQFALANKDQAYLQEFQNQVLDFIAMNPPRFGVNWRCTMDVGIRVSNWLVAYDLFHAYGANFDDDFVKLLKRSVYEHGRYIITHLEWSPDLRSNHYLSDIVGLLFVAAYLPKSEEVSGWLDFAVDEIIKEVKTQFHNDGSNFEASTSYHRLSGDLVIHATLLILAFPEYREKIPDWYLSRLEKIAEFTIDITRPDSLIPQIGDNDNGRFLKLVPIYQCRSSQEITEKYSHLKEYSDVKENVDYWDEIHLDHKHLVSAINAFFNRDDFSTFTGSQNLDQSLARQLLRSYDTDSIRRNTKTTSNVVAYPDFGLYIYRDENVYLAIRCGSNGQNGNGGHAHNDQLSFELAIDGVTLISDPGTYLYTPIPDKRNTFRSTAWHNTVHIKESEQNRWNKGGYGLFRLFNDAHAHCIEWVDSSSELHFKGEYSYGNTGIKHTRAIRYDKKKMQIHIEDFLTNDQGNENIEGTFVLHTLQDIHQTNHSGVITISKTNIKQNNGLKWLLKESLYSPHYGATQSSSRLMTTFTNKSHVIINLPTTATN